MKTNFQYDAFIAKLFNELDAIKGKTRAEIIVAHAFIEFMIDEILETLNETDKFGGTKLQLDKKLDYLSELGWLSEEMKEDLKKFATIRRYMAHRIDVYDKEGRKLLENELKQIHLIKYIEDIFPQKESEQKSINAVSQIYLRYLYHVLQHVQEDKDKSS